MINVTAKERDRTFYVRVGDKDLGKVVCHENWTGAFVIDPEGHKGYRFLENFKSITGATKRVLRHAGYGNPESVKVQRLTGVKS